VSASCSGRELRLPAFDTRPAYSAHRIGECEVVEGTDRPCDPPRVLRVDVIWNPFTDLVPRNMRPRADEVLVGGEEARAKKRTRNLALLSFGGEAEADECELDAAPRVKHRSVHDVVAEDDPLLARAGSGAEEAALEDAAAEAERAELARSVRAKLAPRATAGGEAVDAAGDFDAVMRSRLAEKRRELAERPVAALVDPPPAAPSARVGKAQKAAAAQLREAEQLRRLGLTKAAAALAADVAGLYSEGEVRRRVVKHRKLSTQDREAETLSKLARFAAGKGGVSSATVAGVSEPAEREGHVGISRFAAQGLYYAAEADDDGWKTHAFTFAVDKLAGGDASGRLASDYEVIDPRRGGKGQEKGRD